MKIPFLDRFKKESAHSKQTGSGKRQTPKLSPLSKPEGDKLSKTVMPNVTRSVSTMQEMPHMDGPSLSEGSFEVPSTTPRPITLGPRKTPKRDKDLPPAVALALEPRVERAVSLDIADVIGQMPAGLTKPLESIDKSLRILIKASDLEKDMSNARPKVALTSLYSQAPDIFLKPVPTSDTTEINLPFDKVLEAFMHMQVRRDQVSGEEVPQVETPFLQVTLEDSERFGVPNEPLPAAAKPSARAEAANAGADESQKFIPIPATAAALAAASPEAAAAVTERAVRPVLEIQPEKPLRISLTAPSTGSGSKTGSDRPSKAAPDRIPFHLPPKETGAPAPERVPASSGPPVSSGTVTRARVPSEMPPAETEFRAESHIDEAAGEQKISLALKPILLSLPVFELSGDPKEVPEDSRIEFSFSLVQSQLATGRIAVPPELFERALPPDGRRFFSAKNLQMPVLLPLQEVLKNLPSDALRMRDDQEEREANETIETPFSTAAAEDAQRLKKSPPAVQPELPSVEVAGAASAMDAKAVIARANALPGLRACVLSFTDGLNLAGNLPAETGADALCAIAPALWERIENHLGNTGIGEMNALTLHCTKSTITFFRHANICMAALHENGEITDKVRAELGQMLTELSRTYSLTKG